MRHVFFAALLSSGACSGDVSPVVDLSATDDDAVPAFSDAGTEGGATRDGLQSDALGPPLDIATHDLPCTLTEGCDDNLACTLDTCEGPTCGHNLKQGFCLIAGTCFPEGTSSPNDSCKHCNPDKNANGWSEKPSGDSCNDGQDCTYDDVCTAGNCAGTTYSCPADSLACTTTTCNGLGPYPFGCNYPISSGHCLIEGNCLSDKTQDAVIACRACQSEFAQDSWSPFLSANCIMTLAGTPGIPGDINGPVSQARFKVPTDVVVNPAGDVIVFDRNNNRLRLIKNGQVSYFAGTGNLGFLDGPAGAALFNTPSKGAVDSKGAVYVVDTGNNRIRKIDGGLVTTLAGDGSCDYFDGPAATSQICQPTAIAVDAKGVVYFSDQNPRVRMIYNGFVSTLAGDGTKGFNNGYAPTAQFDTIVGIAVDVAGVIYVAEAGNNNRIRKIYAGQVTTFAGTGGTVETADLPLAMAEFPELAAMAMDSAGTIYLTDTKLDAIRMIKNGWVTTIAAGSGYKDGDLSQAQFGAVEGITVGPSGAIYMADEFKHTIRVLFPPAN